VDRGQKSKPAAATAAKGKTEGGEEKLQWMTDNKFASLPLAPNTLRALLETLGMASVRLCFFAYLLLSLFNMGEIL